MKVFCATLIHETNCFSPIPITLDSYRESVLYFPSTGEGVEHKDGPEPDLSLRLQLEKRGHEAVEGLIAIAQPALPTKADGYKRIREEIIGNLEAAMPVDAVTLFLHGAQMAEGEPDCEGDILSAIRNIVGPDIPVAAEIDLHGNVTDLMIEKADLIVSCQEYPHTDFGTRMTHMLSLVEAMANGEIQPTTAFRRVPLLGSFFTTRQPMRDFTDRCHALEGQDGILSVSLVHGFAWSDFDGIGASVIVVTDGNGALANRMAEDLAQEFFALREQIVVPPVSVMQALDMAMASHKMPAVIADTTDNPGGGAPGDSTYLLREIINRGIDNAAVGMIWDPGAVRIAKAAGAGSVINMRIGGKTGPTSGDPIDVVAKILQVRDDAHQCTDTANDPLGPAAAIEADGVQIVLNTIRQQVFNCECFTQLGIDPQTKRLVVVKSHQHFHAAFAPFAGEIIYAMPPGVVERDFSKIPYSSVIGSRWPVVEPPFDAFGKTWQ